MRLDPTKLSKRDPCKTIIPNAVVWHLQHHVWQPANPQHRCGLHPSKFIPVFGGWRECIKTGYDFVCGTTGVGTVFIGVN